jgi:hypothetical protein
MTVYKGAIINITLEDEIRQNPQFADYYIMMHKIRKEELRNQIYIS